MIHCSHLLPQTNECWKRSSWSPAYLLFFLIIGSILPRHVFDGVDIQAVQQYTKLGPSARRTRPDCWDGDCAVHRSCKRNLKRNCWREYLNIFDRLSDSEGRGMNCPWPTYSTIKIMFPYDDVFIKVFLTCQEPRLWCLQSLLVKCLDQNPWQVLLSKWSAYDQRAPTIDSTEVTCDGLPPTTCPHLDTTTVILPNSGGPFQMGISMST